MNSNSLKKDKSKQNYLDGNFDDSHEEYLDEKMDQSLFRRIFRDSFKKLKEDCQQIINKYLEELSTEKIAEDLGLTPMYVRKRKSLCQQALLNHIAANSEYKSLLNNNEISETSVLYVK
jgi:RNA polymerase sigma factor (sigma-70 family)